MKALAKGSIVRSLQGRDKGQLYLLVDMNHNRLYLVDGKHKTMDKPKLKNPMHIQIVDNEQLDFWEKVYRESNIDQQNAMIRSQLKKRAKEE